MCSIIVAKDKQTTEELILLNQHRGDFSFSCTNFINNRPDTQVKAFGGYDFGVAPMTDNLQVCHVQAPTGGMTKDTNRIHPTMIDQTMLWHNGILTPRGIRFLQDRLGTEETFDTKLLHQAILRYGYDILSQIEGMFSCVYYNGTELHMFRTKHGKLFTDLENISSERFPGSRCIDADRVYRVSDTEVIDQFRTLRYNYVIPGEMT